MEDIVIQSNTTNENLDTEKMFLNVLLEKFEPILDADSPSVTQQFFSKLKSNKNSFFFFFLRLPGRKS